MCNCAQKFYYNIFVLENNKKKEGRMKNSQFSRLICFLLFGADIAAMFIVAGATKGSSWTAIGWIIGNFGYGFYWFVIVAVLLVVASFVIPKKLAEMEKKEEEQQKARDE